MAHVGKTNRTRFRDQEIKPLLELGWLEMTIPDKPTSSRQKYRSTETGRKILNL
jgi:ATP-dependent DNA helicase RecG